VSVVAGVAPWAADGGGPSITCREHTDLQAVAVANFVELRRGLTGDQNSYQLLPRDARRLARELLAAATAVDGLS
jgi:hypothetical protein